MRTLEQIVEYQETGEGVPPGRGVSRERSLVIWYMRGHRPDAPEVQRVAHAFPEIWEGVQRTRSLQQICGRRFYDSDGGPLDTQFLRIREFVLGKAKMQMRARGVIECPNGDVRVYSIRHVHNPDLRGNTHLLSAPFSGSFEKVVGDLRQFESQWITEEKGA